MRLRMSKVFDQVIGNPPYGKNSNLAIKFLNLAGCLSKQITFVLPRTFRKTSAINRVRTDLHLTSDNDVANGTFPDTITACWQSWELRSEHRSKIQTINTHPDFEFVDKAVAQIALGRVGAGPCGRVYEEFSERSINTHFFLCVKSPEVIDRLRSLETKFREQAHQTVGMPSLTRPELVKIYSNLVDNKQ